MIELIMTIALVLYFVAYFVARRGKQYMLWHIPIALIAFTFDLYGTWIMFNLDLTGVGIVTTIHTTLTLIAISLFFIQGYLGVTKQRAKHIFFAQKIFLPMWVISFASGGLYLL